MRGAAVEGSGPYFIKPGRKVYYAPNELGPNRLQDGHVSLNCKAKVHISSTTTAADLGSESTLTRRGHVNTDAHLMETQDDEFDRFLYELRLRLLC
jgi:hypothetical protein